MKEYTNLRDVRSPSGSGVYCPKCGNYLKVVCNGFFHGEAFYCPKEKRVFIVQLVAIKTSKEFLEQAERDVELDDVRRSVVIRNVKEVKKLIDSIK